MAKKSDEQRAQEATFACNLRDLEQIVNSLERGEVELEKSLELYERGAKLIGSCRRQLQQAEMRIEKMRIGGQGEVSLEPMADDIDDDGAGGGEAGEAGEGES